MCLVVSSFTPNPKASPYLYKVYTKTIPYWNSRPVYMSFFQGKEVSLVSHSKKLVSSRHDAGFTVRERATMQVHFGFHGFTNRKDAREFIRRRRKCGLNGTLVIARFRINKKDFVATGTFSFEYKSAVYHKIAFDRFVS